MTDQNSWVSPDSRKPVGADPYRGSALPLPPAGWAPPPRPGLVPLAPLALGTILGGSFRTLRRNPRPLFGVSLVIHGIIAVVTILLASYALTTLSNTLDEELSGALPSTAQLAGLFGAELNSFATFALTLVGTNILLGIVSMDVARGTLGERLNLSGLWRRVRGRLLVLVGWALLMVAVILVFTLLLIGLVAIAVVSIVSGTGSNPGAVVGAVLLGLLVLAGGLLVLFGIGVKLSLVPSVLVIERLALGRAMRRSWSLTRGYFWRTLGIELLVVVMIGVATSIVTAPVAGLLLVVTGLSHPTGVDASSLASSAQLATVISAIISAIVASVTAIVSTASTSLIYLDLRIRKEGLDLQLMRFLDARQSGAADVPDPYLIPRNPAPPPFPPPPPGPPA